MNLEQINLDTWFSMLWIPCCLNFIIKYSVAVKTQLLTVCVFFASVTIKLILLGLEIHSANTEVHLLPLFPWCLLGLIMADSTGRWWACCLHFLNVSWKDFCVQKFTKWAKWIGQFSRTVYHGLRCSCPAFLLQSVLHVWTLLSSVSIIPGQTFLG